MEEVGALIKRLREEKGLSQRQLAALSGVDRGYINQLEGGKKGSISLRTARKLASALGKPPGVFLQNDTSSRPETSEEILERLRLATPITIPIYTDFPFHAGNAVEPIDYIYRARHKALGEDIEGYIVQGDCLEPQVFSGDIIIIDKKGEIKSGNVVAYLIDDRLYVARLKKIDDELWLENNLGKIKFEDSQVRAKVIEIRRSLK